MAVHEHHQWRDARATSGPARLAAAVATHGLPGADSPRPDSPLDDATWREFVLHVQHGRVPGLLMDAIDDGWLPVTAEQHNAAAAMQLSARALAVVLDELLCNVAARLRRGEVQFRVLKGAAVARLDYPRSASRTYGDIDLLVPGPQMDQVVAILEREAFVRRIPQLRRGFDRRFGKGAVLERGAGLQVDVHRAFVDGPFGFRSAPQDLFADLDRFDLNGVELPALSAVDRFVHACFHVALSGHLRLSSVRDVAQLALVTQPDVTGVHDRFEAWRAEPVLARAMTLTWQILDIGVDAELKEWSDRFEYDRRSRRLLAASVGESAGWKALVIEGLRELPGIRSKALYLHALLWPDRRFIREMRDRRRRRRFARGLAALRSRISGMGRHRGLVHAHDDSEVGE
ncbi:MAG: nucleotidyltransferase family protein [Actinobacteria bacterium]|nr:nucleotidyltransferase family protein [Actinomycetota bacterium]